MRRYYFWSFITSSAVCIVISVCLLCIDSLDETATLILSTVLSSFILLSFTNLTLRLYTGRDEKQKLKIRLIKLLDQLGTLVYLTNYSAQNVSDTSIPGFEELQNIYISISDKIQEINNDVISKKYRCPRGIKDPLETVSKSIIRINIENKVIRTSLEKAKLYKAFIGFVRDDDKQLHKLFDKIQALKNKTQIEFNDRALQGSMPE